MFFKKTKASGVTAEIRVRRCYGCGAILQDTEPDEAGYIPTEKLNEGKDILCERCYKLRHYSKFRSQGDLSIDYMTILSNAKEEDALFVYVLNAFCLEASILHGLKDHLSDKILVVVNKADLLGPDYNKDYLIEKTKALFKEEGINPLDIILTSSGSKNNNIDVLIEDINKLRNGKSVYVIGAYQVGKSSLINCILMDYTNSTDKMITTSPYPGTTLDVISIPLDNKSYLYDTPGIYNSTSIITFLEPQIIKYVLPRSEVKREVYVAKDGQSFIYSNLARIDFPKGDKTQFVFYKSNDLTIERCKVNKADELFDSLCKNESLDTRTVKISSMKNMKKTSFTCKKGIKYRLVISGLTFVTFEGLGQTIDVYAPEPVQVILSDDSIK